LQNRASQNINNTLILT